MAESLRELEKAAWEEWKQWSDDYIRQYKKALRSALRSQSAPEDDDDFENTHTDEEISELSKKEPLPPEVEEEIKRQGEEYAEELRKAIFKHTGVKF